MDLLKWFLNDNDDDDDIDGDGDDDDDDDDDDDYDDDDDDDDYDDDDNDDFIYLWISWNVQFHEFLPLCIAGSSLTFKGEAVILCSRPKHCSPHNSSQSSHHLDSNHAGVKP